MEFYHAVPFQELELVLEQGLQPQSNYLTNFHSGIWLRETSDQALATIYDFECREVTCDSRESISEQYAVLKRYANIPEVGTWAEEWHTHQWLPPSRCITDRIESAEYARELCQRPNI